MGLIFDGIDLKTNYNFVVTSINGRGSPPVSRTMLELPRIDGAIELNSKLQSRNITISGYVYGTDASIKKDALIKLITQAYSQEKKLTFPDTNRSIYVKLAGEPIVLGPVGPVLNAQAYELTFNFVAQDPYFYGEDHDESGFRIVKVNAHAPIYLISPRRKFLKREAAFKIEPYTIVNLLGKYGDFEDDSNGDGLADGWGKSSGINSSELVAGLFDNYAQKCYVDGTRGWDRINTSPDPAVLNGHTYFVASYIYSGSNTSDVYPNLYAYSSKASISKSIYGIKQFQWERLYFTFTASTDGTISIEPGMRSPTASLFTSGEYFMVDGAMLVDLTAMGALPYGLQQYFSPSGIIKWEDLATTSNIEALDERVQTGEDWLAELLPFVNGVKTLGFAWESDV